MLDKQLVLPGIDLEMCEKIKDPEFTFGVEIELVRFYNGEPYKIESATLIENRLTGIIYNAVLIGERKPSANGPIDHYHEIEVEDIHNWYTEWKLNCKVDSDEWNELPKFIRDAWKSDEMPEIELEFGELPSEWIEDTGHRHLYTNDKDGNEAIDKARSVLNRNGLSKWKVEKDESLTNWDLDAIELISPVLKEGEFDSIRQVCSTFEDKANVDRTCGLHIHIGIRDHQFSLDQLIWIARKWLRIEKTLTELRYYQNLDQWMNHRLEKSADLGAAREAKDQKAFLSAINQFGRRVTLNFFSLAKQNTLEFRGFKSTLNSTQIENLVKFCVDFVKSAIS